MWLSTKHLRKHGEKCRKLLPKYMGPFLITARIGTWAYRLDLPSAMSRLHNVFHVALLAPHHPRPDGAPADPKLFDAVPQELDPTADPSASVPSEITFHRILRHRESELAGQSARDYLVSCRQRRRDYRTVAPRRALAASHGGGILEPLGRATAGRNRSWSTLCPSTTPGARWERCHWTSCPRTVSLETSRASGDALFLEGEERGHRGVGVISQIHQSQGDLPLRSEWC